VPRFVCVELSFEVLGRKIKGCARHVLGIRKWVISERVQLVEIVDLISQEFGDVINVVEFIVTVVTHLDVQVVEKAI